MGRSEFDQAFEGADDELFSTFGQQGECFYDSREGAPPQPVSVVLQTNVSDPAGGSFVAVHLAADLRISQVPNPCKGDLLTVDCKRYLLDEYVGTDGLINRFSLMPAD